MSPEPTPERYPELYSLAQRIARDAVIKIRERAPYIKTREQIFIKERATLELLIDELKKIR